MTKQEAEQRHEVAGSVEEEQSLLTRARRRCTDRWVLTDDDPRVCLQRTLREWDLLHAVETPVRAVPRLHPGDIPTPEDHNLYLFRSTARPHRADVPTHYLAVLFAPYLILDGVLPNQALVGWAEPGVDHEGYRAKQVAQSMWHLSLVSADLLTLAERAAHRASVPADWLSGHWVGRGAQIAAFARQRADVTLRSQIDLMAGLGAFDEE